MRPLMVGLWLSCLALGLGPPAPAQEKPKAVLQGPKGEIRALAFSPDGKLLAAGAALREPGKRDPKAPQGGARLWDVASGKERAALSSPGGVLALAFTPDDKKIVTASALRDPDLPRLAASELAAWDLTFKPEKPGLKLPFPGVHALAVAPDGKTVAVSGWTEEKKEIAAPVLAVIDLAEGKERATIKGTPPDTGSHPVLSAPGLKAFLWAADGKGLVLVQDGGAKKEAFHEKVGLVYSLALTPDGKTLACGHDLDGQISLWDVAGRKKLHAFKEDQDRLLVAFTAGGKELVSVGDRGMLKLWDVATGKEKASLPSTTRRPTCLAVAGGLVAVGSKDGTVSLWEHARLATAAGKTEPEKGAKK